MQILAGILCLLVAAAGWYYMFYSRAAQNLSGIEDQEANRRRVFLRRVSGGMMCALAVVLYIGIAALGRTDSLGNARPDVKLFAWMMLAVLALMAVILVFGLMDLRLTQALRRRQLSDREKPPTP
ncbi:hypothetical protein BH09PLA1_BH09PLA1_14980 [soil metagenome]